MLSFFFFSSAQHNTASSTNVPEKDSAYSKRWWYVRQIKTRQRQAMSVLWHKTSKKELCTSNWDLEKSVVSTSPWVSAGKTAAGFTVRRRRAAASVTSQIRETSKSRLRSQVPGCALIKGKDSLCWPHCHLGNSPAAQICPPYLPNSCPKGG